MELVAGMELVTTTYKTLRVATITRFSRTSARDYSQKLGAPPETTEIDRFASRAEGSVNVNQRQRLFQLWFLGLVAFFNVRVRRRQSPVSLWNKTNGGHCSSQLRTGASPCCLLIYRFEMKGPGWVCRGGTFGFLYIHDKSWGTGT